MNPWRIVEFSELDSTQDEQRRRLEQGVDVDRLVIRAAVQTGGRGQRGRDWHSGLGGSWQTAALKGAALPASSLFMGVGIAAALNGASGAEAQLKLKWPNDLLLQGRKVAGILCEASRGHLLVGVGVNVGNAHPAFAASLGGLELEQVHALVLQGIDAGWRLMQDEPANLEREFAPLDALAGKTLGFERGGVTHTGVADGIDKEGRLRLITAAGVLMVDSAVSLRPVQ